MPPTTINWIEFADLDDPPWCLPGERLWRFKDRQRGTFKGVASFRYVDSVDDDGPSEAFNDFDAYEKLEGE